MLIYLVRHAHALAGEDDAARPLSPKGKRQIRIMTRFLQESGRLKTSEFWHSPLVRAKDTAYRLAEGLHCKASLTEKSGMEPASDPTELVKRLAKQRRPVAIVGHEPHLSTLATLLLLGRAEQPFLVLKKCSITALERKAGRWRLRWQISPKDVSRSLAGKD
jgi:phosphohistidine phosphatase